VNIFKISQNSNELEKTGYYNLNQQESYKCDKVCQWFAYFGTPVSSTYKIEHHDITEILLKVALNTVTPTP
jgi:hypothetical protein